MIGYFKIIDRNTKEVLEYHRYSMFSDAQKQLLRDNPKVAILCACNDKALEMRISTDLRVYPAEQLVGHLHELRCPKHINFVPEKL